MAAQTPALPPALAPASAPAPAPAPAPASTSIPPPLPLPATGDGSVRGKYDCLWCPTCKRGLLSCLHAPMLIDTFVRHNAEATRAASSDYMSPAGGLADRGFVLRFLAIWDEMMRSVGRDPVLVDKFAGPEVRAWWRERIEDAVRREHGTVPPLEFKRLTDHVNNMMAERRRLVTLAQQEPPPSYAAMMESFRELEAECRQRLMGNHTTGTPSVSHGKQRTSTDARSTPPPSDVRGNGTLPAEKTSGGTNRSSKHDEMDMDTPVPAKRKRLDETRGTKAGPNKRPSTGSRARGRNSSPRRYPRASSFSAVSSSIRDDSPEPDHDDSMEDGSDDSLIARPGSRVPHLLKNVPRARLTAVFMQLCRDHKRMAVRVLLNACQNDSILAEWVESRLTEVGTASAASYRSPQTPAERTSAEAEDGVSLEDLLAQYQKRPQPQKTRRPEPPATDAVEAEPEEPAPLPCKSYHQKYDPVQPSYVGPCQYHPGFIVWRSTLDQPDVWSSLSFSKGLLKRQAKAVAWTCCRGYGDAPGCQRGQHVATGRPIMAADQHNITTASPTPSGTNSPSVTSPPDPGPPSEQMLNTMEFLAQHVRGVDLAQLQAPPSTAPAPTGTPSHPAFNDFPTYARGLESRHKAARGIAAGSHREYPVGEGCRKCTRSNIVCLWDDTRDKCAFCCSQNQSAARCQEGWDRGPAVLVPANPHLTRLLTRRL